MEPAPQVQPFRPTNRLITLKIELSHTRTRGKRLRNRTESYVMGLLPSPAVKQFTPPADLFTFCCYRALLLGYPAVIVRATVQPGGRNVLTDPLAPLPLLGETTVEDREWSNRKPLMFRMQGHGVHSTRHFFGYRWTDGRRAATWTHYERKEVILDRSTGAPPTFADEADYQRKVPVLAKGKPPSKAQAWSTWCWLLLNRTFGVDKASGQYALVPWYPEHGIEFRGVTLMTAGR